MLEKYAASCGIFATARLSLLVMLSHAFMYPLNEHMCIVHEVSKRVGS